MSEEQPPQTKSPADIAREILGVEEFARLNEQLASLGDDALAELSEVKNESARLSPDEVYRMLAIYAWRKAYRHPMTGGISRDAAGIVLGILDKITDEGVADEFVGMEEYLADRDVNHMPAAFARFLQILCQRRGLGTLVAERRRALRSPSPN